MFFFALACAPCDEYTPCRVKGGRYFAVDSISPSKDQRVVVMMHGWNGTPQGYAQKPEIKQLSEAGFLVLLPEGKDKTWNVAPNQTGRDEVEFILRVLEDAQKNWDINEDMVFASGFSMGAAVSSLLACEYPDFFNRIAPTSGGFFVPLPPQCPQPISVRHVHGTSDGMWPIEGRVLWEGFEQSAIDANLTLWREVNGCSNVTDQWEEPGLNCTGWLACENNTEVVQCLHDDGHIRLPDWGTQTAEWFLQSEL